MLPCVRNEPNDAEDPICTAAGLALAIPCYAGYNYLVSRVNAIVLDMEKAATEIANMVTDFPQKPS